MCVALAYALVSAFNLLLFLFRLFPLKNSKLIKIYGKNKSTSKTKKKKENKILKGYFVTEQKICISWVSGSVRLANLSLAFYIYIFTSGSPYLIKIGYVISRKKKNDKDNFKKFVVI